MKRFGIMKRRDFKDLLIHDQSVLKLWKWYLKLFNIGCCEPIFWSIGFTMDNEKVPR